MPEQYLPKSEREEKKVEMPPRFCLVCKKKTDGYGTWQDGFTCSRDCEDVYERRPRDYGEHEGTPAEASRQASD